MESKNLLLVLAVVAVAVALANVAVTLVNMKGSLTGYAVDTEYGYVNLTITSSLNINLSRNNTINWGAGVVNTTGGFTNATLYTIGASAPSITGGTWTCANCKGLLVENVGNVNCSQLNITFTKTAATLFNAPSGQQLYQWNLSANETGSCVTNTSTLNTWYNTNTSNTTLCHQFGTNPNYNAVNVDIKLTVPYDSANTGALSDTITFTCYA